MTFSIIKKSQLEGAQRIDAEYFQMQYLDLENKLKTFKTISLDYISERIVNFGAYSLCNYIEWQEKGVPYLNVGDIKDGFIDYSNVKYISEKVHEILSKSVVKEGDVVMPMAGSIGNIAVADNIPKQLNSNQALAKITLKKGYSPYFVTVFFRSKFGKLQILREIVSSVQANIFLFQIKAFRIPVISYSQQLEIEEIYKDGLRKLDDSKQFYKQAENLLLEELGLNDFKAEEINFTVVHLSEVRKSNRMDSDYFLPKYNQLIDQIKKFKFEKLGDLLKRKTSRIKILPDQNYKYIEISDVNVGSGEVTFNEMLGKKLPVSAQLPISGDELIVSKVRPTRGAISNIPENWSNNFVCSGAFSVFENENNLNEYLFVVLRSIVGKLQMERPCTGTSYPTITDQDIENILIPILPQNVVSRIINFVIESHSARQKSKELLNEAKRKIEEIIEKGSA